MRVIRSVLVALCFHLPLLHGAWAAEPQAIDLAGVHFETSVPLGNKRLLLNGAGVRYRLFFKVAAVALYLPVRSGSTEAALAATGPKRIRLVMLRSVSGDDVGKALSSGLEANATRQEFIAALPAIARIGEAASQMKTMSAGDAITFDWIPDEGGARLFVNDKLVAGPYPDFAAFSGISKIWLGKRAADEALREALLGHSSAAAEQADAAPYR